MEIKTATGDQVKCIMTMLGKLGLREQKAHIVAGVCDGRTESTKELTRDEAKALIEYLKSQDPEEVQAEVMRRKLIAMAYERAALPANASKTDKQAVVDRLNDWCVKYGYLHKKLNSYTYKELPTLVSQYREALKSYYKSL